MRSPFNCVSRQTTAYKKVGSTWKCGYHTGVDRVSDADKTIVAIADGVVQRVNDCGKRYGNHVVYWTTNGIVVLCAHMKDTPSVKVGEKIKAGQKLGVMGSSGNCYGAHLHIELQKANKWQYAQNLLNPNDYIDWNDYPKKEWQIVKDWKNGSTSEPVYQSTTACKGKTMKVDELAPRATAKCYGICDGCYLLVYKSKGVDKCGFVAYSGGV